MAPLAKRLSEIKSRLEAATPGPWDIEFVNGGYATESIHVKSPTVTICKAITKKRIGDARLIAHAPADISRLLAALELAIEQRDEYIEADYYDQAIPSITDRCNAAICAVLAGSDE